MVDILLNTSTQHEVCARKEDNTEEIEPLTLQLRGLMGSGIRREKSN